MAFVRYGDGEVRIMQAKRFKSGGPKTNDWSIQPGETTLGKEIRESLVGHAGQPFYYGFRGGPLLEACLNETDQNLNYITYANIFMFANAKNALSMMNVIQSGGAGDVVIFANEFGKNRARSKFKTLKSFHGYADNSLEFYDSLHDQFISEWKAAAIKYNNTLFLFSIGPLSNIAIHIMWQANPKNRYIDVGSRLDMIIKGYVTRSGYSKLRRFDNDPAWFIGDDGRPHVLRHYLQIDIRKGFPSNRSDFEAFS